MSSENTCRNCGITEFYYSDVDSRGPYGPNLLPIGGVFSNPKFVIRVCGTCGIVDWFVPNNHLAAVRATFVRKTK